MRVKSWTYRELREGITDGYTLRPFTDFYCQPVPKHDAFNRAFNRLTPEALHAVNELVVQAAVGLGVEEGQKLRVDVQTDIHHSTDNTLLWDVVRVVTRLVLRLGRGSTAYRGVSQSHAGGTASDARDPADDTQGTAPATS